MVKNIHRFTNYSSYKSLAKRVAYSAIQCVFCWFIVLSFSFIHRYRLDSCFSAFLMTHSCPKRFYIPPKPNALAPFGRDPLLYRKPIPTALRNGSPMSYRILPPLYIRTWFRRRTRDKEKSWTGNGDHPQP